MLGYKMRGVKIYLNHPGRMTAIAAMCIIVKPLKFFFSRVSRLKTRELGKQHWVLKCYQSKWWPLVDWTNCIFKSVNAIWYLNMWMQFAPNPHYCRKSWTNLSWIHFQLTCSKAQEELQLLLGFRIQLCVKFFGWIFYIMDKRGRGWLAVLYAYRSHLLILGSVPDKIN